MSILCFTKEMQSFLGKWLRKASTVVLEKPPQTLLFCWGVYSQTTNLSLRMQRQNDLNVIPTVLYITTPHKSKLLRRGWVYLFILSIIFCESMRKKIYLSIGSLHYIIRFSLERFQWFHVNAKESRFWEIKILCVLHLFVLKVSVNKTSALLLDQCQRAQKSQFIHQKNGKEAGRGR